MAPLPRLSNDTNGRRVPTAAPLKVWPDRKLVPPRTLYQMNDWLLLEKLRSGVGVGSP